MLKEKAEYSKRRNFGSETANEKNMERADKPRKSVKQPTMAPVDSDTT